MKVTLHVTIGSTAPNFNLKRKDFEGGNDMYLFAVSTAEKMQYLINSVLSFMTNEEVDVRYYSIITSEIFDRKIFTDSDDSCITKTSTVEVLKMVSEFQEKMEGILKQYKTIGFSITKIIIED